MKATAGKPKGIFKCGKCNKLHEGLDELYACLGQANDNTVSGLQSGHEVHYLEVNKDSYVAASSGLSAMPREDLR